MDWFSSNQDSRLQGIHIPKQLIPRIKQWFGPNKLSQLYFLKFLRIMRQVKQKLPKWWEHHELLAEYMWMKALGEMFRNAKQNHYCIRKEYYAIEYSGRCLIQYYEDWMDLLKKDVHSRTLRKSVRKILKLAQNMKSVYEPSCNDSLSGTSCDYHEISSWRIEFLRDTSDDNLIAEKQQDSYKRLHVVTISKSAYEWMYKP